MDILPILTGNAEDAIMAYNVLGIKYHFSRFVRVQSENHHILFQQLHGPVFG